MLALRRLHSMIAVPRQVHATKSREQLRANAENSSQRPLRLKLFGLGCEEVFFQTQL